MAASNVTLTISNSDGRRLEQTLTRALRSKGNLLTLARCAEQLRLKAVEQRAQELVAGQGIVTDIDRGRALWVLLREAMERLRPTETEPEPTPAWRLYAITVGVYIQGKPARQVTTELGISPRTFHRERRAAVEAMAMVVRQIESQTRPKDGTG